MPELPDVEIFKHYLDATSLHQQINQVVILHKKIVRSIPGAKLSRILKQRKLEESYRHCKVLFAKLNACHGWLWFHFGMTGFLTYGNGPTANPEEHVRFILKFANGCRLQFHCQRLFGQVGWIAGLDEYRQRHKLGPDALGISQPEFIRRLQGMNSSIKTTLMNQSVLAGIGNVYSDEILFQARIHPQVSMKSLNDASMRRIYRAMQAVLTTSIHHQADPQKMPRLWLLKHRRSQASCPRCGGYIKRITVNQRSAYFCGTCQSQS